MTDPRPAEEPEALLAIDAPHFYCGVVVRDDRVIRAAPIVRYTLGWTAQHLNSIATGAAGGSRRSHSTEEAMTQQLDPTSTTPTAMPDEAALEVSLRPQALRDFVGHDHIKDALGLMLAAAKRRSEPVDHILFHGPPGTGKTTLSWIIAHEMGVPMRELSAPAIRRPGDLAAVLVSWRAGRCCSLTKCIALANETAEMLYHGIEDYRISLDHRAR